MVIELRVLPLQDIVPSYFYILFPPTHSSSAECKAVFRIRTFFPDPDRTSFPESGSAKNRDPIQKIRIQIHEKKTSQNCNYNQKNSYIIFITLNTVLFGLVPPKPNQKHHLDLGSLLMDGSGFLKSGSAKKPGSIQIRNTGLKLLLLFFQLLFQFRTGFISASWTRIQAVSHNADPDPEHLPPPRSS